MLENVKLYTHPKLLVIFFLGMSQGFPWVIISSGLTLWLKESGIDRATIGFAGAILAAYSINFVWSPLLDRLNLGPLGKWLGNRRAWILCMQAIIVAGCLLASTFDPGQSLRPLIITCIAIGFAAATQDVAIDAFRIESFAPSETKLLTAGASMITAGWWTGYAALGFFPLWLADAETWNWSWPRIYPLMALMMGGLMLAPLLARERPSERQANQQRIEAGYVSLLAQQPAPRITLIIALIAAFLLIALWSLFGNPGLGQHWRNWWGLVPLILLVELGIIGWIFNRLWLASNHTCDPHATVSTGNFHRLLAWLLVTIIQPLKDYFSHNGTRLGLALLAFIVLFKIGEAFLGRMSLQFYVEVGYTETEIATYSKLVTWWVTIICAPIAGIINMRFGIVRGLFISGIAMAATNLLFSLIAMVGPNVPLFAFTIVVDGFTQAWSTIAFVSLISMLCDRTFTAAQYALLASLSTFGRTLFSSSSGLVVDWLEGNWALFFMLTSLMVIPGLLLLWRLASRITALENSQGN